MRKLINHMLLCLVCLPLWAAHQPEFSTAGFFRIKDSGRDVYSMNPAWRFYKGGIPGAEAKEFNDKDWAVGSLPHGIEYLPTEASGCINYQGETSAPSFSLTERELNCSNKGLTLSLKHSG